MRNLHGEESRLRGVRVVALILSCTLGLLPLACGDDDDCAENDEQILRSALRDFGKPTVVLLDTAELGRAARAGG